MFEHIKTPAQRERLAKEVSIDATETETITRLADVSRIRWVGSTFATVLVKAGFDSLEKVANADYTEMYVSITALNQKEKIYKGNIGLNDMKLTVETAKQVPLEVEY